VERQPDRPGQALGRQPLAVPEDVGVVQAEVVALGGGDPGDEVGVDAAGRPPARR
jgi:hypothetical protein